MYIAKLEAVQMVNVPTLDFWIFIHWPYEARKCKNCVQALFAVKIFLPQIPCRGNHNSWGTWCPRNLVGLNAVVCTDPLDTDFWGYSIFCAISKNRLDQIKIWKVVHRYRVHHYKFRKNNENLASGLGCTTWYVFVSGFWPKKGSLLKWSTRRGGTFGKIFYGHHPWAKWW